MHLYKVDLETFNILQISFIEILVSFIIFLACSIPFESSFEGLPPILPLALAAFNPAWVLSRINSLSNSAREANIWKISFPPEVVVSIFS